MDLATRMKLYEQKENHFLLPNIPVIMRLDGRAFHSYTKNLQKPWDVNLRKAMIETTEFLSENIQGVRLAYTQSDEISLIILNKKPEHKSGDLSLWFDYNIQKIVSISASMATAQFNKVAQSLNLNPSKLAFFDSRVYNCPFDEVENYLIFRQQDAVRNSIQSLAQANFSHKSLQGLSCKQLQDKLFIEKSINWNNLHPWDKRGIAIVKKTYEKEGAIRTSWEPLGNTPEFHEDEERAIINNLLLGIKCYA